MPARLPQDEGPLVAAVRAHRASNAVLAEASALDRELERAAAAAPRVDWGFLLGGVEAFADHYPATLLGAPAAVRALGQGCLQAARGATSVVARQRAAAALLRLASSVCTEVSRVGADRVADELPRDLGALLGALGGLALQALGPGELAVLGEIGRAVLLVAEEGRPPALWFALLDAAVGVLLEARRLALARELGYDGRLDRAPAAAAAALLGPASLAGLDGERAWLEALAADWRAGRRPGVEVFLDLEGDARAAGRAAAWEAWLRAVLPPGGPPPPAEVRAALAGWLDEVQDRAQLGRLAAASRALAEASARVGQARAEDALPAIMRLEREAGRGALEPAHEALRAGAAALLEAAPEGLALALRLRTGPVAGLPLSLADLRWRLGLLEDRPSWARPLVLDTLAAFGLERMRLPEARAGAAELADVLAGLLGRCWPEGLWFPLRALLRLAPLPPLELSGPTTRATLLALAPARETRGYLVELRERVIHRPGPDNLADAERVLAYWRGLDPAALAGLASPDALAALPLSAARDADIARLLRGLALHAPGEEKQGVRWLGRLPPTFHAQDSLRKLCGFEGLREEAVQVLARLLHLHRALVGKYAAEADPAPAGGEPEPVAALLARADELLARRAAALGVLFRAEVGGGVCLEGLDAFERLSRFVEDLRLGAELDHLLEELARRTPPAGPAGREVLRCMLAHARLSGLGLPALEARLAAVRGLDPDIRQAGRSAVGELRGALLEELEQSVQASCRRLRENPLAEPAPGSQGLAPEPDVLGAHLVDDLLAGDGGLLTLGRYLAP